MPGLQGSFNTEAALMDIEIAIVLLVETRIEETVGLTAIDPDNQKNVDRENAKATQEFEDAGNSVAVGRLDVGFQKYAEAWQHAAKAEEEALKLPPPRR